MSGAKKPTQELLDGLYAVLGRTAPSILAVRQISIHIDHTGILLTENRVLMEDGDVPDAA